MEESEIMCGTTCTADVSKKEFFLEMEEEDDYDETETTAEEEDASASDHSSSSSSCGRVSFDDSVSVSSIETPSHLDDFDIMEAELQEEQEQSVATDVDDEVAPAAAPMETATASDSDVSSSSSSSGSRVSFYDFVQVTEIPSHYEFSDSTRHALWWKNSNPRQQDIDMERNTFEYASDGEDWRAATEEDNFAQLPSGEWVHPATWLRSTKPYGRKNIIKAPKRRRNASRSLRSRSGRSKSLYTHTDVVVMEVSNDASTRSSRREAKSHPPMFSWLSWLTRYDA